MTESSITLTGIPTHACKHCGGSGLTTDHASLGRQLRAERLRAGISLRDMARRMGIRHPSLRGFEIARFPWPKMRVEQFRAELEKR